MESEIAKNKGIVKLQTLEEQKLKLQIKLLSKLNQKEDADEPKYSVEEMFSCLF